MNNDPDHFEVLRKINNSDKATQRGLANELGFSLGKLNYCIKALKDKGAKDIYVYITHAVLSGQAINKIEKSQIKKLITTDIIDNSKKTRDSKKIEIISIAPIISEAMKRIANSTSVSSLFK